MSRSGGPHPCGGGQGVAPAVAALLPLRGPEEAGRFPVLVLTRKSNQSIMIGDDIEVSVLSIMGEKVRIGIQAPRDIPVFRKEVYLEIQQERGQAMAAAQNGHADSVRGEVDAAPRAGLGLAAQALRADAVLLDLLDERPLQLGEALAHAHRSIPKATANRL